MLHDTASLSRLFQCSGDVSIVPQDRSRVNAPVCQRCWPCNRKPVMPTAAASISPIKRWARDRKTWFVGATEKASALGDRRWRDLLDGHNVLVRRELAQFRGREIKTAGDGFFAAFDGPARAVRCACAVSRGMQSLGLEVRAGLHTGECEIMGDDMGGIAVHIGARIAALAAPREVLVSSTVKDLVAGSGLSFRDHGAALLKGVPGEWRLFSVG